MTTQDENQNENVQPRDDLMLEPERIKDLDLDGQRADDVRGGACPHSKPVDRAPL